MFSKLARKFIVVIHSMEKFQWKQLRWRWQWRLIRIWLRQSRESAYYYCHYYGCGWCKCNVKWRKSEREGGQKQFHLNLSQFQLLGRVCVCLNLFNACECYVLYKVPSANVRACVTIFWPWIFPMQPIELRWAIWSWMQWIEYAKLAQTHTHAVRYVWNERKIDSLINVQQSIHFKSLFQRML